MDNKIGTVGWSRDADLPIRGAYTEESQENQHDVDGRRGRSVSPITAMHSRRFFLFYKQKQNNEKVTFVRLG